VNSSGRARSFQPTWASKTQETQQTPKRKTNKFPKKNKIKALKPLLTRQKSRNKYY
jgi:hypothetical protein